MNRTDYENELKKVHTTQKSINCYTSAIYGENSILNEKIIPQTLGGKRAMISDLSPNELLAVLSKLENALNNINSNYSISQAHLQNTVTYLRSYRRYVCSEIENKI